MEDSQTEVFRKESTYSGSPKITVQFILLISRDLCFNRWINYLDQHENSGGREVALRRFKASLKILYENIRPRLETIKEYAEKGINDLIEDNPEEAFTYINDYLEKSLKLTKIDNRQNYDTHDITQRNKIKLGY